MSGASRIVRLARTPAGVPEAADFAIDTVTLAAPAAGELLVAVETISLDPYLRLQMARRHLSGNLEPGMPVVSECVARVLESGDPAFSAGDTVAAFLPWAERAVVAASAVRRVDFGDLPASLALGVLGMPGLTAWAGVTRLLKPGSGDVLAVSAAAGPVGATVGQMAKARGARVIGIAGGPAKCGWVRDVAGFDDVIDYKAGDLAAAVRRIVPDGPSCYFDNVGGEMLSTMLGVLRPYGRIALCGIISDYNGAERTGDLTPLAVIGARATLMGLVVYDHEDGRAEMEAALSAMIRAGTLAWREDVAEGLDAAPGQFARLMRGETEGKAVVRLEE